MNQEEIERRARRLLAGAGIEGPPVDIEKVAQSLRIKIELSDLGEDCSGILVRKGERAVIGVNWNHHRNRQRFSIAHELAHYELHEGDTYVDARYRVNFRDLESGSGTKTEEVQANAFAAALLMPASWMKPEFKDRPFDLADDGKDLQALAEKFQVSTQAMAFRLANLRIV